MKLSPLRVVVLLPLLACASPPGHTDATDRTSPVVTPPPSPPAPTSRLVALTPAGALCVLDAATGAVLSTEGAAALDLAPDQDHPGALATLVPARDDTGQLARYRLRGVQLERTSSLPFDAPEGRLLRAGDALVGVAQTEMSTLFWAREGAGSGKVWGPVTSAATLAEERGIRVQTAGLPDGGSVTVATALVSAHGVESMVVAGVNAPRGTALFTHRDGFGRVDSTSTGWRVVGGSHDGVSMEHPDSFPVEAIAMGPGRLAVLTGPTAQLWVLSPWGAHAIALGDESLDAPDRVSHRLVYDASRQRVWVVAGHTAYAVELPSLRIAATGGCPASALAVITPEP